MGTVEEWPLPEDPDPFTKENNSLLVVTDNDFEKINTLQKGSLHEGQLCVARWRRCFGFDLAGSAEEKIAYGHKVGEAVLARRVFEAPEGFWYRENIREEAYADGYTLYGGFLFLGIFLGGLFLMGTAMIIYYKQISEGYDDKGRFEIMRKVGMSRREVKSSIRRQILMIFFPAPSHGGCAYCHGIPAGRTASVYVWPGKYRAVCRLHRHYDSDFCGGIRGDLSSDSKGVLQDSGKKQNRVIGISYYIKTAPQIWRSCCLCVKMAPLYSLWK